MTLSEDLARRADRALMALLLTVMLSELVWLASGWPAARAVMMVAMLGVTVAGLPRYGLREAYLLSLAVVLAGLTLVYAPDPAAVFLVAMEQAGFLTAFIALIGLIQQAASTAPAIRECGLYLTRQPAGRRYFGVFLGAHFMAQLFNLGVASLLAPLIKGGSMANTADALQPLRERRQLNAMLRGFAWAVVWSPTAVAPLVVMTLLPEARRGPWMAMGLAIAVMMMVIGWAEDRFTFRKLRRTIVAGAPRVAPPFPRAAFAEFGAVCAGLLGLVLAAMAVFDGSVVFGLMAASPVVLVLWLLHQYRGDTGATARRVGSIGRSYLPGIAAIAATVGFSGFIGRAGAALLPTEALAAVLGVAQMPGWLFLLGLSVGVLVLSQFAMIPVMMAVFFGSIIADLPVLPVDATWAALAIACGWALATTGSPFATVVLMTQGATGHRARTLSWVWNTRFTLLCVVALAGIYRVLAGW